MKFAFLTWDFVGFFFWNGQKLTGGNILRHVIKTHDVAPA